MSSVYVYFFFSPGDSFSQSEWVPEYYLRNLKLFTLQYSCLENSMNRGTWWATAHGVAKSQACTHIRPKQIFKEHLPISHQKYNSPCLD